MSQLEPTQSTEVEIKSKPKEIFKVSASSLVSIDQCGQLYEYSKVKRLRPAKTKRALDYGSLMHFMLHPYRFGQIKDIKDHHLESPYHRVLGLTKFDLVRVCAELGRVKSLTTDLIPEDREACIEQFMEYVSYYSSKDKYEVLEVEQPFSKVLYENDSLVILYEGIMDMLVYDPDWGNVPYDTKTGGWDRNRPPTEHQLQGTCWAFNSNKFVIDKVLTVKDEPFRRQVFSYMDEHIEEWRIDAIQTALKGVGYIKNDYFPRHRSGCGMFGGCDFLRACKTNPSSREYELNTFFSADTKEFYLYSKDEGVKELLDLVLGEE